MLDKNMIYSCAYWKNAETLEQAQENKCKLICEKLYLKPGMKILDIGCGWGGLALYAAKNYGVEVIGVTISQEQAEYAREITKDYPVEIRLQDYREIDELFDRIVSVGMFEHVGVKNYKTFMNTAHTLLKDGGLLLLHTIGSNSSLTYGDPWITKYIFTNGMLPSVEQIARASQGLFVMEDWHNFGADYDKTLMAWNENFEKNWPLLQSKYGDRFYRMWKYYLLSCAGVFRARGIQLWQIVFSKSGVLSGYHSIR
jgi:cyclopropane-fatty-acyl-phospholipid synthase